MRIDWQDFLVRHDLLWDRLPTEWYEAPFLGNGMMGTMILKDPKKGFRLQIHRSDVQDHRDNSHGSTPYSRPRLPIGHFTLEPVGEITGASMRLDLWNAELRGEVTTESGRIGFIAIVHSDEMAIHGPTGPQSRRRGLPLAMAPGQSSESPAGLRRLETDEGLSAESQPPDGRGRGCPHERPTTSGRWRDGNRLV